MGYLGIFVSSLLMVTGMTTADVDWVHLDKRVINGQPLPEAFPWLMSLRNSRDEHICGANLIKPTVAVTGM